MPGIYSSHRRRQALEKRKSLSDGAAASKVKEGMCARHELCLEHPLQDPNVQNTHRCMQRTLRFRDSFHNYLAWMKCSSATGMLPHIPGPARVFRPRISPQRAIFPAMDSEKKREGILRQGCYSVACCTMIACPFTSLAMMGEARPEAASGGKEGPNTLARKHKLLMLCLKKGPNHKGKIGSSDKAAQRGRGKDGYSAAAEKSCVAHPRPHRSSGNCRRKHRRKLWSTYE